MMTSATALICSACGGPALGLLDRAQSDRQRAGDGKRDVELPFVCGAVRVSPGEPRDMQKQHAAEVIAEAFLVLGARTEPAASRSHLPQ